MIWTLLLCNREEIMFLWSSFFATTHSQCFISFAHHNLDHRSMHGYSHAGLQMNIRFKCFVEQRVRTARICPKEVSVMIDGSKLGV